MPKGNSVKIRYISQTENSFVTIPRKIAQDAGFEKGDIVVWQLVRSGEVRVIKRVKNE